VRPLVAILLAASIAFAPVALVACRGHDKPSTGWSEPPADGLKVTDPVDGKSCAKFGDTQSAIYDSRTYYFCAPVTAARFVADPAKFADTGPPLVGTSSDAPAASPASPASPPK
jgi:YHS domain-containing protein